MMIYLLELTSTSKMELSSEQLQMMKSCKVPTSRQIGNDLTIPGGVATVDAMGALVLPGGVDASTGFQKTFQSSNGDVIETVDDFYSGSKSAIAGGTTTYSELN